MANMRNPTKPLTMNKTKTKGQPGTNKSRETLRMCAVCRRMLPKPELLRIVRTPDGAILADHTGRMNGRGVYLCGEASCRKPENVRKALRASFRTETLPDLGILLSDGGDAQ